MRETFDPTLKAKPTLDDADRVRGINHLDEFWAADTNNPRQAAMSYLRQVADVPAVSQSCCCCARCCFCLDNSSRSRRLASTAFALSWAASHS